MFYAYHKLNSPKILLQSLRVADSLVEFLVLVVTVATCSQTLVCFPLDNSFKYIGKHKSNRVIPVLEIRAFWDRQPCNFVGVDRRFRNAYCVHH